MSNISRRARQLLRSISDEMRRRRSARFSPVHVFLPGVGNPGLTELGGASSDMECFGVDPNNSIAGYSDDSLTEEIGGSAIYMECVGGDRNNGGKASSVSDAESVVSEPPDSDMEDSELVVQQSFGSVVKIDEEIDSELVVQRSFGSCFEISTV